MRKLTLAVLALALIGCPRKGPAGPASAKPDGDHLGALYLGQPSADVVKAIGEPETRGDLIDRPSAGDFAAPWEYPAKGLTLELVAPAKAAPLTVASITCSAPCALRTDRGIGVGSSPADVKAAYGDREDKDHPMTEARFVVDSLFGGIIFSFEGDRVTSIFFGAAAE
jgi:hypothetical protein